MVPSYSSHASFSPSCPLEVPLAPLGGWHHPLSVKTGTVRCHYASVSVGGTATGVPPTYLCRFGRLPNMPIALGHPLITLPARHLHRFPHHLYTATARHRHLTGRAVRRRVFRNLRDLLPRAGRPMHGFSSHLGKHLSCRRALVRGLKASSRLIGGSKLVGVWWTATSCGKDKFIVSTWIWPRGWRILLVTRLRCR